MQNTSRKAVIRSLRLVMVILYNFLGWLFMVTYISCIMCQCQTISYWKYRNISFSFTFIQMFL